jgi:hypothetical protein
LELLHGLTLIVFGQDKDLLLDCQGLFFSYFWLFIENKGLDTISSPLFLANGTHMDTLKDKDGDGPRRGEFHFGPVDRPAALIA